MPERVRFLNELWRISGRRQGDDHYAALGIKPPDGGFTHPDKPVSEMFSSCLYKHLAQTSTL